MDKQLGPWRGIYGVISDSDTESGNIFGELQVLEGFWPFNATEYNIEQVFRQVVEIFLEERRRIV